MVGTASLIVEGDRGVGHPEKRERELYGRGEKRGGEAEFPRWWEVEEKKCKDGGANKHGAGTRIKVYGKWEV